MSVLYPSHSVTFYDWGPTVINEDHVKLLGEVFARRFDLSAYRQRQFPKGVLDVYTYESYHACAIDAGIVVVRYCVSKFSESKTDPNDFDVQYLYTMYFVFFVQVIEDRLAVVHLRTIRSDITPSSRSKVRGGKLLRCACEYRVRTNQLPYIFNFFFYWDDPAHPEEHPTIIKADILKVNRQVCQTDYELTWYS